MSEEEFNLRHITPVGFSICHCVLKMVVCHTNIDYAVDSDMDIKSGQVGLLVYCQESDIYLFIFKLKDRRFPNTL